MNTHKELHEGLSGSGHTVYLVVTVVDATGAHKHAERFDTKAEAVNWIKWA